MESVRRRAVTWATVAALSLGAAACGQKTGVAGSGETVPSQVAAGPVATTVAPTAGAATTPEAGPVTTTVAATPAAPAPGGTNAPPPASTTAPPSTAAPTPPPGDRTGITATEIKIGLHAPVTGAAPFPQATFDDGKDVYWEFVNSLPDKILGRKVTLVFRDDGFNPVQARQVCVDMAEKEQVFMLLGGGGADQITACAQYANSKGIPYLSTGVNEVGLADLATYFAVSETYSQQSAKLAALIKKSGKTSVGVVATDSRSFDDAFESFTKAAQDAGINVVYRKRISKEANETETLSVAAELAGSGARAVYLLASPLVFLSMARSTTALLYAPEYYGPGITGGLNTVAGLGCPTLGIARFLSPFPQLDVIDGLDKDYQARYRAQKGKNGDDIGIALWGLNKVAGAMLQAAGKDLTRQGFIATLESGKTFTTNVFPPVTYGPRRHFGAGSSHLLQADCNAREWRTIAQFATGF